MWRRYSRNRPLDRGVSPVLQRIAAKACNQGMPREPEFSILEQSAYKPSGLQVRLRQCRDGGENWQDIMSS
jgi:hypothetical protein